MQEFEAELKSASAADEDEVKEVDSKEAASIAAEGDKVKNIECEPLKIMNI